MKAQIKEAESKKNFNELDYSTKTNLKNEFNRAHPKYSKFIDKESTYLKVKKISNIFTALGLVIGVIGLLMGTDNLLTLIVLIIGLLMFFVSDIVDIICPILIIRNKKKSLIILKKYQKWLCETKNIDFPVVFSHKERRWKRYFENINPDFQDV
jgi:hypothetical protein